MHGFTSSRVSRGLYHIKVEHPYSMVHFRFNQAVPPTPTSVGSVSRFSLPGADFSRIPRTQMIKGLVLRFYLLGYDLTPPA